MEGSHVSALKQLRSLIILILTVTGVSDRLMLFTIDSHDCPFLAFISWRIRME